MDMKDKIKFDYALLAAVMDGRKMQVRILIEPHAKVTEDELCNLSVWQEGYTLSEQVRIAWRHGFINSDWLWSVVRGKSNANTQKRQQVLGQCIHSNW